MDRRFRPDGRNLWGALALSLALLPAAPVVAASFDCNERTGFVAFAICHDEGLSMADEVLFNTYEELWRSDARYVELKDSLTRRARERDRCPSIECIKSWYFDELYLLERSRFGHSDTIGNPLSHGGTSPLGSAAGQAMHQLDPERASAAGVPGSPAASSAPEAELAAASEEDPPEMIALKSDCAAMHAEACDTVANRYRRGEGVTKDVIAAMVWNEISCVLGGATACGNTGAGYYYGDDELGLRRDNVLAIRYLKRSCDDLGGADACDLLGLAYYEGRAVRRNFRKVQAYHEKSCALRGARECPLLELSKDCAENTGANCNVYQKQLDTLIGKFVFL